MVDLSTTVAPKVDQLTADDLIGGPRTIKITKVSASTEPDQPINVYFEGDNGKPYRPCKSMRRVFIHVWGTDGASFAGRSMTLYRDSGVKFGGLAVGGIRISHMSDMKSEMTMALTATKANKKAYTVKPLQAAQVAQPASAKNMMAEMFGRITAAFAAAQTQQEYYAAIDNADVQKIQSEGGPNAKAKLATITGDAHKRIFAEGNLDMPDNPDDLSNDQGIAV